MMTEKTKNVYLEKISKYFLLLAVLSFLGWAYEASFVFLTRGVWKNVGFMRLPFCPIYGFTLLSVYFLGGTPTERRGILKAVPDKKLRYIAYFALAFIMPTAFEFFVGLFLDKGLHLRLWSYQNQRFNINGYVALPVSLFWAALIFAVMRFVFPVMKKRVFALEKPIVYGVSILLLIMAGIDLLTKYL